ncbi:hypothetical protein THAOC_08630 [Thalassiosira oceanica]|uniref:N-acetylglucosaminylphosphatidylinositol deacetylase n=1 Tax=Thalassiosira oceanica TaxID=159749 RepID=K0SYJ5_THAOC|nr:hypothetical protein THAOC_08630 [Thalassiosira oceanica]|eukprot:EJK70049.1 hypothetical protein THAOC_08630 [Thalassiosira oceanica]
MAGRPEEVHLLVTSHPDDESMFFVPALRHHLVDDRGKKQRPPMHVLCLSNGDYPPSDGAVRTKEMHRACSLIGVDGGRVTVLDDATMKDGPDSVWDADRVSRTVLDHIRKIVPPLVLSSQPGRPNSRPSYLLSGPSPSSSNGTPARSWEYVDEQRGGGRQSQRSPAAAKEVDLNIITFDSSGVSGHPNHMDTHRGVKYLVNERCRNTRSGDRVQSSLRLCRRGADRTGGVSNASRAGEEIRLNLKVYVLHSVSNPVAKYFPFVEILYHYLRQVLWRLLYLAYLLLGFGFFVRLGSGQKPPSFWPSFTGTAWSGADRPNERQHYRLMDPTLVWRSMAAHASQFVWYRRLFVVFSRYTYINDTSRLEVDPYSCVTLDDDDNDGCQISGVEPVTTVHEEVMVSDFLLSPAQMTCLRDSVLPTNLHHRSWSRVYSLSRDGDSFAAFERLVGEWNSKSGGHSTLLVVKSSCGGVLGGFSDVPLVPTSEARGSAHQSCLFRIRKVSDEGDEDDEPSEPAIDVYGKECATSSKTVVLNPTKRLIAFGGGYIDGPDEGVRPINRGWFRKGDHRAVCCVSKRASASWKGRDI